MMIKMRKVIEMTSFMEQSEEEHGRTGEKKLKAASSRVSDESQSQQQVECWREKLFSFLSRFRYFSSHEENVIKATPESASFSFMVHNECSISSEAIKSSFVHIARERTFGLLGGVVLEDERM